MTEAPHSPSSKAAWTAVGLIVLVGLLGVRTAMDAHAARVSTEQALAEARAASAAAAEGREAAERAGRAVEALQADLEMLAAGVGAAERQIKELADQIAFGGAAGNPFGATPGVDPGGEDAPPAQPVIEFSADLRESLRRSVAAKGVDLREDRVVIPGKVILRQGALELLAVFPGGKAHESIFVLTGTPAEDGAPPEGLGAALNSCLMALGLRPGTPLRILPGGRTIPPRGTPVHLYVEWEEEGEAVRVRAGDLLWDRERNRSLEADKWIYVGSYFDPDGAGYVPDLTGDAVACYSVATCIVDLDDARAANDTIFVACGPRIPPEGTPVRMVFSRDPLEPTRAWDPEDPSRVTVGTPPPGAGEEDGGGK